MEDAVVCLLIVIDIGVALLDVDEKVDLVLASTEEGSFGDKRANGLKVVLGVYVASQVRIRIAVR